MARDKVEERGSKRDRYPLERLMQQKWGAKAFKKFPSPDEVRGPEWWAATAAEKQAMMREATRKQNEWQEKKVAKAKAKKRYY